MDGWFPVDISNVFLDSYSPWSVKFGHNKSLIDINDRSSEKTGLKLPSRGSQSGKGEHKIIYQQKKNKTKISSIPKN